MGTPNRQLRIHRVPDTKTITEQSEITSSAPCRWQQCSFSHFPMESVSCSRSPTQAPSPRPVAPMTRPQSSSQWWTSGPGRRPELSVRPWVPLPGPSPRGRWDLHPCLPATGREGVRAGETAASWLSQSAPSTQPPPAAAQKCLFISWSFLSALTPNSPPAISRWANFSLALMCQGCLTSLLGIGVKRAPQQFPARRGNSREEQMNGGTNE